MDSCDCSLKQVYEFLMKDVLNRNNDDPSDDTLAPLRCETNYPMTDWKKTWKLVRSKGLGPELTSLTLKILWGIVPTRARLHRILPLAYTSPNCLLCETPHGGTPETVLHALLCCEANLDLPARLLRILQRYQPGAEQRCLLTLDLDLEPSLELPFTWLIGTLLSSIWSQRESRRVDLRQTRAELEAKCRLLRECKVKTWANAHIQTEALVSQVFSA